MSFDAIKVLVCIDDTDDLDSPGTGELAEAIITRIQAREWGQCSGITRHQLLVHEDIPYTSHNSAMCFEATLRQRSLVPRLIAMSGDLLQAQSAPTSDPGLAVAVKEDVVDVPALIEFGLRAKRLVVHKHEAYDLASAMRVHLSEHGGSGLGVIGALAGLGLLLRFLQAYPKDDEDWTNGS